MHKKLNFRRSRQSEKGVNRKSVDHSPEDKPHSIETIDKVGMQGGRKELKRRDFMKLSAVIAGGALVTFVLESSLTPLSLLPTAKGQPVNTSKNDRSEMALVTPIDLSASNVLDPLNIPKFENQLAGPPPVYDPKVITSGGKVIRHEYTVTMTSSRSKSFLPR